MVLLVVQVAQVHQELLDLVELMAQVVLQDLVGQVEVLELLDLVEQMAQAVHLALQELVALQGQMVLQVTPEIQDNLVPQVHLAQAVVQVQVVYLNLLVLQDHQEHQVQMVP